MQRNRDTRRALIGKLESRRHSSRDIQADSLVAGLNAAGARLFTDRAGAPESVRRYASAKLGAIAAADRRILFNGGSILRR